MTVRYLVYLLAALLAPLALAASDLDDVLQPLLEGEFALQQRQPDAAAEALLQAAARSDDPAIAQRATQVALLAGDIPRAGQALERWRSLAPDDEGLVPAGLRLALLGANAEAVELGVDLLMQREDGWREVLAAAMIPGAQPAAGAALDRALGSGLLPERIEVWQAFGGALLRLDESDGYARFAAAAVERFPNESRAFAWLAQDAQARGDTGAARRALDQALGLPGLGLVERLALAAQLAELGDPQAAARALEPVDDEADGARARAVYLARAEDTDGLERLYDKLQAAHPPDLMEKSGRILLGQIAELREMPEAALGWYQQVPEDEQPGRVRLRIAVLLNQAGDTDAAISGLRRLQADGSRWDELARDAYLLEAELERGRGDPLMELGALERGLSIFSEDTTLRYARALVHERLDRLDEAIAGFRSLVATDPEEADFLNALGYTLVDRTDRLEEGLALIEAALERKPDSAAIMDSLGWALHRLGHSEAGLPHLERAFEQLRDAEIAAHLAIVLDALGRAEEARSILRLALEIDPENRAVQQAADLLQPDAGT